MSDVIDRLRNLLGLLVLLGALAASGTAVLAEGGRWSGHLDVFAHFMPLWVTAGLGLSAVSGGLLRPPWQRLAVLSGILALICGAISIAPELAARLGPKAPDDGPVLKLVQFNLWKLNQSPQATLDWILAQKADIILVEEAENQALPIREALMRAYPNWSSSGLPNGQSVMVFSRLPMTARGAADGPPLAWASYRWQGRDVMAVAIHNYWPIPPGPQRWQLRRLARALAPYPKRDMILTGDFNAAPWSFSLQRFDHQIGLPRRTHGIASWPAGPVSSKRLPVLFPILAIDQVYAGQGWRTVSVERGPKLGSDHYPIVARLAPAP